MTTIHRPDPEFVGNLERELRSTIRRQGQFDYGSSARAGGVRKFWWTTALVALSALCLGSAATLAVTNRLRAQTADLIIARSHAHLEFAEARLKLVREEFQETESRAAAGVLTSEEVDSMRQELLQVEADAAARALDVEEARITGCDPDNALSAPIVRGRDFVTERLELEQTLHLEKVTWIDKQLSRPGLDSDESSMAAQAQDAARAALATVEQRLALRQDYLSGVRTARQLELAEMRASVEPQRELATRRVQELQRQLDRFHALFEADLVSRSEVRSMEMQFRAAVWHRDLAGLEMQILERKLAVPSDP